MEPFLCILQHDATAITSPEGQLYVQAWSKRYQERTHLIEPFVPSYPETVAEDADGHLVVMALTRSDTPSRPETYGKLNAAYITGAMKTALPWISHALRTLYALPASLRRIVPAAGVSIRYPFSKAYFRCSQVVALEDGQVCLGVYCYGDPAQLTEASSTTKLLASTARKLMEAEPVMTAVSSSYVPSSTDDLLRVNQAVLVQGFGDEILLTQPEIPSSSPPLLSPPSLTFCRWFTVAQSDHPALWEYCTRHVIPAASRAKESAAAAYQAADPANRAGLTPYSTEPWLGVPIWLKDVVLELTELQVSYESLSERTRTRSGAAKHTDLAAFSRVPKLKYRLRLAEARFAGLRGKDNMPKFPPLPLGVGSNGEKKSGDSSSWKRPAWAMSHEDLGLPAKKVAAAAAASPSPMTEATAPSASSEATG